MTSIYLDSDTQSTSSTDEVELISFIMPPGSSKTLLKELSLNPDSNFAANGTFRIQIEGQQVQQSTLKALPVALTIPFWQLSAAASQVEAGAKVSIFAKSSTGTITLSAFILGETI